MALLGGRAHVPDEVRRSLDLHRGERVLAGAELTDGWAVATTTGLHITRGSEPALSRQWSDVDAARLDADTDELTVTWVDGARPTVLHLVPEHAVTLARTLHERVQSSVVHTEKVTLPGGAIVRVAARRTADGTLVTQVLGPGDVDLTDPATASLVDAAEARVRDAVGLD